MLSLPKELALDICLVSENEYRHCLLEVYCVDIWQDDCASFGYHNLR